MKRLLPILLWSAISAAFVGPGTVTTAGAAGAGHGLSLLWALLFSVVACLALQEAAARLTVATGQSLGQAMRARFGGVVPWIVVGAVVLGCAAYQAGNILGAVAGASLGLALPAWAITLATGVVAGVVLWSGSPRRVAQVLGGMVAVMGLAFLATALDLLPGLSPEVRATAAPAMPPGSGKLVLGLIGTTVVPYNLFLGSGLAHGQSLRDIRLGLGVAIPLGGLISIAILITGTAVAGEFSYEALSAALGDSLGRWAGVLFAVGLFCAGLSSAITSPLAAALSIRGVAGGEGDPSADRSWRFRGIWLVVLVVGLAFGLADVKPIPAIIAAQALNGLVLPFVAVFLWIATSDRHRMGDAANGPLAHAVIGLSCAVAALIGISSVVKAVLAALS